MRHLLSILAVMVVGAIGLAIFADIPGNLSSDCRASSAEEVFAVEPEEAAGVSDEHSRYYGDTLCQYWGHTVMLDFSDSGVELSSGGTSKIMTYVGSIPVDSCRVIGDGIYVTEGTTLKFVIGVDTVCYDMRNLPDSIDPARELLPEGATEHRWAHTFGLSDSIWVCNFRFRAFLPQDHPAWIKQFIAIVMRNDIQALFLDNKGVQRIFKEYYGIRSAPKKIGGINASTMSPEQIAGHFSSEFERLYKKEFNFLEADEGPIYDYLLEVAPAWASPDGSYVTYRFYSYYYTGGAHGYMEEYYLTFDNDSGRLLGYEDIIGKQNFPGAIQVLERQLTAHRTEWSGSTDLCPAALNEAGIESNNSEITKETYGGYYYPRPAITREGIVFSYQPYEKGSFSEGILHFVQPYQQGGGADATPLSLHYPSSYLFQWHPVSTAAFR